MNCGSFRSASTACGGMVCIDPSPASTLAPAAANTASNIDMLNLRDVLAAKDAGPRSEQAAIKVRKRLANRVIDSPVRTLLSLRSEEHTSELQSLRHLVCRLLLEKKKQKKKKQRQGSDRIGQNKGEEKDEEKGDNTEDRISNG